MQTTVAKEVVQAFGHLDPGQLTPLMPGALLAGWLKKHRRSTAYGKRLQLQRLLQLLQEIGAPRINLAKVNKPEARSTVATPEELVSLFNSPPPYLRLFMLLYLQCGLRRSETLRVTPRSWDPEAHTVTIEVKGGRKRVAQLTPDAENLLRAIDPVTIDPDKPFLWAQKGRRSHSAHCTARGSATNAPAK